MHNFISPSNEVSMFKGIPNTPYWHNVVKEYFKDMSVSYTKRYRGPRIHGSQSVCKKCDATSFAVYINEPKAVCITRVQAFENLNAAYKEADDVYDKALRDLYAAGDVKSAAYIAAYKAYEAALNEI